DAMATLALAARTPRHRAQYRQIGRYGCLRRALDWRSEPRSVVYGGNRCAARLRRAVDWCELLKRHNLSVHRPRAGAQAVQPGRRARRSRKQRRHPDPLDAPRSVGPHPDERRRYAIKRSDAGVSDRYSGWAFAIVAGSRRAHAHHQHDERRLYACRADQRFRLTGQRDAIALRGLSNVGRRRARHSCTSNDHHRRLTMSGSTPNLDLEYLDPSQAQPEVKINDAWDKIDAAVGSVAVSDLSSPPIVARAREIKFSGGVTVTHETGGVALVHIDTVSGGSGSPIDVMDGTTEVTAVTAIRFTRGATASVSSGSVADVYIDPVSGGSGGTSRNETPDSHPVSPMDADDEFEGTVLDTAGTRRAGATPGAWVNQNGASIAFSQGAMMLTEHLNSSEDVNFIAQAITTSSSAWRYRAKISGLMRASYNNGGIMLRESSTGKICEFGLVIYTGAAQLWVEYAPSPTSGGTAAFQVGFAAIWPLGIAYPSGYIYLEVELASG